MWILHNMEGFQLEETTRKKLADIESHYITDKALKMLKFLGFNPQLLCWKCVPDLKLEKVK